MDDQQVGAVFRAIRRRRGLRQVDVAAKADVDQAYVSLVENGHLEDLPLRALRRIGRAIDLAVRIDPRWRGPELASLFDAEHARLVDDVVRILVSHGWEVHPEWTFNHFGERGSVDVLAWHAASRTLLLVEVKTRIVDQQDLLGSIDRKRRIVPELAAQEYGWAVARIGSLVVVAATTTNRRVVRRHAATFDAVVPERGTTLRAWLAQPDRPLGGLWFLPSMKLAHATQPMVAPQRVRRPRATTCKADPSVDVRSIESRRPRRERSACIR